MSDDIRKAVQADTATTSQKRPWTQPKIEKIEGREASGSIFSYGGPDSGIYS